MVFEITLTRLFSYLIWHHFASMVISIALLGFGVSGIVLQMRPKLGQKPASRSALYAGLFGITSLLAVGIVARVPFDPTHLVDQPQQALFLAVYYLVLLIPFTLAGLAIVTLLSGFVDSVQRVYASDLAGAGLGCLCAIPLLDLAGAEGSFILTAALATGAAALLNLSKEDSGGGPRALAWSLATVLLVSTSPFASFVLDVPPGAGKALHELLDRDRYPDAQLVHTEWNAMSRIDVVEKSSPVRWTWNARARVPLPPQTLIVIDGDASTPIVELDGSSDRLRFLDFTLSSAAFQAFRPADVLVIGAGGGVDVLTALHHGATTVDAVEINPAISRLASTTYAARGEHLFQRDEVDLYTQEGRAFVRQRGKLYDLIQLSLIDTWAASASGAYSLAESYLYTVEAFQDYLDHLTSDGVLTITRWHWEPPRESLKLVTVAVAALQRIGVQDPDRHIIVLGVGRLGSILVQRSPYSDSEITKISEVAALRGFDILFARGVHPEPETVFGSFLRSPDRAAFLASYPFDVSPPTDDSPFFFQFGRWSDIRRLGAWSDSPLALSGRLVLLTILAQATVLSFALLAAPLWWRGRRPHEDRRSNTFNALSYFFLIGLSFMLLEITLMQRFILFLGHPVYALTFVLAVLLIGAGAGSFCADSLAGGRRRPWPIFAAISCLSVIYAVALPEVFTAALSLGLTARIGIGLALIFPLGFLLGIPFPAAISRLSRIGSRSQIGWAWAANGCASVIGPILAVLLAIDFGFTTVMLAASVGYAGAYAAFLPLWSASDGLPRPESA